MHINVTWSQYVSAISSNQSEVGRAAGVAPSTVSRWLAGAVQPQATQVIAVARAFGESPVLALLAAGYITADEMGRGIQIPRGLQLRGFTELELAQELVRRIEAGETENDEQPMNVDHPAWGVSGTTQDDVESLPHAALTSAREIEEDDHTP